MTVHNHAHKGACPYTPYEKYDLPRTSIDTSQGHNGYFICLCLNETWLCLRRACPYVIAMLAK